MMSGSAVPWAFIGPNPTRHRYRDGSVEFTRFQMTQGKAWMFLVQLTWTPKEQISSGLFWRRGYELKSELGGLAAKARVSALFWAYSCFGKTVSSYG